MTEAAFEECYGNFAVALGVSSGMMKHLMLMMCDCLIHGHSEHRIFTHPTFERWQWNAQEFGGGCDVETIAEQG
jgi:hypothetical protein